MLNRVETVLNRVETVLERVVAQQIKSAQGQQHVIQAQEATEIQDPCGNRVGTVGVRPHRDLSEIRFGTMSYDGMLDHIRFERRTADHRKVDFGLACGAKISHNRN